MLRLCNLDFDFELQFLKKIYVCVCCASIPNFIKIVQRKLWEPLLSYAIACQTLKSSYQKVLFFIIHCLFIIIIYHYYYTFYLLLLLHILFIIIITHFIYYSVYSTEKISLK